MMNGSKLMEGYIPEFDATVVTRVLDEGKQPHYFRNNKTDNLHQ